MKKPGKGEEQFIQIFLNSFFALIFPLGGCHLVDWELSKNNRDFMYLFVSTPGCVGYFAVVIMSAHLLVSVPNQFARHA